MLVVGRGGGLVYLGACVCTASESCALFGGFHVVASPQTPSSTPTRQLTHPPAHGPWTWLQEYSMLQLWPVRAPRPVAQKLLANTPLLTGQVHPCMAWRGAGVRVPACMEFRVQGGVQGQVQKEGRMRMGWDLRGKCMASPSPSPSPCAWDGLLAEACP